jgi:hypothetical protein
MARFASDQNCAAATFAAIAADLSASHSNSFPQEVDQQHIAGDRVIALAAIQGH